MPGTLRSCQSCSEIRLNRQNRSHMPSDFDFKEHRGKNFIEKSPQVGSLELVENSLKKSGLTGALSIKTEAASKSRLCFDELQRPNLSFF